MSNEIVRSESYKKLISDISVAFDHGRAQSAKAVNTYLLHTYWQIGQYIVEFEQGGAVKAVYGKALLENLAKDLSNLHGRGFSRSNLNYMRLAYLRYPICETLSHKLSWSH